MSPFFIEIIILTTSALVFVGLGPPLRGGQLAFRILKLGILTRLSEFFSFFINPTF
jgi:hypothetical protein